MSDSLYNKHRPKLFKEVVGQQAAVKELKARCEKGTIPHALMFTGGSGTGKTTLARIVAAKLKVDPLDFMELNAANSRGIDAIRDVLGKANLLGMSGGSRVVYLDEFHKATADAQNCLLKPLEDPKPHCYFMLATSEPAKVIRAVQTRCTIIHCSELGPAELRTVLKNVLDKERGDVSEAVLERIIECCDGSARKALVDLEKVLHLESEEEQLGCIYKPEDARAADALVNVLLKPGAKWADVAVQVKAFEGDLEQLRRRVLGAASAMLLNGSLRAAAILAAFRDHWFDAGKAGLTLACYDVFGRK